MQNAVGLFGGWNQVMERVDTECSRVIWGGNQVMERVDAECSKVILRREPSDGKSRCRMQLGYLEDGTK